MGYIFLVQPIEYVNTLYFKIGISECVPKTNDRYVSVMECEDPEYIEKDLKEYLINEYKYNTLNDCFEIREDEIYRCFIGFVEGYKNDCYELMYDSDMDINNEVNDIFPNYLEDVYFGGNKQLIKITRNDQFIVEFIDDDEIQFISLAINDDRCTHLNILENDKIYDINDEELLNKLHLMKTKITLFKWEDKNDISKCFINYDLTRSIIYKLFTNCILNDDIYCELINSTIYINRDLNLPQDSINIVKINGKYYDKKYIKTYLPYYLEINNELNQFYIINRYHDYISPINEIWNYKKTKREKLYNESTAPWINNNFCPNLYINLYNQLTNGKKCMNLNPNTIEIFNIIS